MQKKEEWKNQQHGGPSKWTSSWTSHESSILKTEKSVFVSLPQFTPTPTLELIRLSRPTKGFKKITKTGNDARNRAWDHRRKP
eukprot:scaffold50355_cov33-Attheya_sp.AAC.1